MSARPEPVVTAGGEAERDRAKGDRVRRDAAAGGSGERGRATGWGPPPGVSRWFRAGLVYLALTQLVIGAWALVSPAGFYEGFPLPGRRWVDPPYNEHLLLDFGGLNLGFGVMLAVAAVTLDRLLVRTLLVGFLVFAVPHLAFHLGHLGHFPPVDAAGQAVTLSLAVLIPVALLGRSLRGIRRRGSDRSPGGNG
ncbi:hypothetical protein Pta02_24870 [Planobispora takensis]|uniref:DUF4345 domain-containing protein n=1 Tax=Planobispora takensis TaxID=1367882 RepID=A0A8J3STR4_9ACTN|nr:hypothetical protein Pta02_24870 [Planobispora takensis]